MATTTPRTTNNFTISEPRLEEIAVKACRKTLAGAESYQHEKVGTWNTEIINTILADAIAETQKHSQQYKLAVQSTIVQHLAPPAAGGIQGTRGIHAATGAFWNADKDGMWSYKYDGLKERSFDVVISLVWVAI